jgi:hypothetical protein
MIVVALVELCSLYNYEVINPLVFGVRHGMFFWLSGRSNSMPHPKDQGVNYFVIIKGAKLN